jgi:hypothetical protein
VPDGRRVIFVPRVRQEDRSSTTICGRPASESKARAERCLLWADFGPGAAAEGRVRRRSMGECGLRQADSNTAIEVGEELVATRAHQIDRIPSVRLLLRLPPFGSRADGT